jgi:hypothetical protein
MIRALGHAARAAGAVLTPAVLVRLGLPAVAAATGILLTGAGVLCWVLASAERADRARQLITALRSGPVPPPPPPAIRAARHEEPTGTGRGRGQDGRG